uniref:Uncharacterized protein n=1 Tax=Candidatus Kentrum sp. FM TaxID=2126340 RepID=A0A450VMX2_9GAMM|nr:MAG: hypothetical protein BECKFM1743B_GA0114221_100112 [Candidatus Kentron sp. FM]
MVSEACEKSHFGSHPIEGCPDDKYNNIHHSDSRLGRHYPRRLVININQEEVLR